MSVAMSSIRRRYYLLNIFNLLYKSKRLLVKNILYYVCLKAAVRIDGYRNDMNCYIRFISRSIMSSNTTIIKSLILIFIMPTPLSLWS